MQLKKIILVYKTHFDIGFTDLSEKVIAQYSGAMLRDVIDTCKGTQNLGKLKYVWTMPACPALYLTYRLLQPDGIYRRTALCKKTI